MSISKKTVYYDDKSMLKSLFIKVFLSYEGEFEKDKR